MRILVVSSLLADGAVAQKRPPFDSNYVITYRQDLIGRTYMSVKYTDLQIRRDDGAPKVRYEPNTKLSLGFGVTYRPITLNIGIGYGFLNRDTEKGETRRLDIKSHLYSNKWVVDLYAQKYRGYFLHPQGLNASRPDEYYLRPDLKILLVGAAAFRVVNNRKYSFRASFQQDTWQRKSAGSFLPGFGVYYTQFQGDSAFVPSGLKSLSEERAINSVQVVQLGPGLGYTYHLVLPLNTFIAGSVTANLHVNYVRESDPLGSSGHVSVNPNLIYRFAAGYMNGRWNLSAWWFNSQLVARGDPSGNKYVANTGNYRITFARRFELGPKLKKTLSPIQRIRPPR